MKAVTSLMLSVSLAAAGTAYHGAANAKLLKKAIVGGAVIAGAAAVAKHAAAKKSKDDDVFMRNMTYYGNQETMGRVIVWDMWHFGKGMCGPGALAGFRAAYLGSGDGVASYIRARDIYYDKISNTADGMNFHRLGGRKHAEAMLGAKLNAVTNLTLNGLIDDIDTRYREKKIPAAIVEVNSGPLWRYFATNYVTDPALKQDLLARDGGAHFIVLNGAVRDTQTGEIAELLIADPGVPNLRDANSGIASRLAASYARHGTTLRNLSDNPDFGKLAKGAVYAVPYKVLAQAASEIAVRGKGVSVKAYFVDR